MKARFLAFVAGALAWLGARVDWVLENPRKLVRGGGYACALVGVALFGRDYFRLTARMHALEAKPPSFVVVPDGQREELEHTLGLGKPVPPKFGSLPVLTFAGDLAGSTYSSQVVTLNGTAGVTTVNAGTLKETGSTLSIADSTGVTRDQFDMTHGYITAGGGGTDAKAVMGPWTGNPAGFAAQYFLPNATAPGPTNYTFLSEGVNAYLNAPSGSVLLRNTNQDNLAQFTTGGLVMESNAIQWNATTTPTINQLAPTSDVAPNNLPISPQGPYASATVHKDAADIIVNTPASVGGSTAKYGGFQVQYAGTLQAELGTFGSGSQASAALWFMTPTPGSTNYVIAGDGTNTAFNAPSGNVQLRVAGNTYMTVAATGATIVGALNLTHRAITTTDTVDATTADYYLDVDTTSAGFTETLPTPTCGRTLLLTDVANTFDTHNLTLARHGTEKIDGVAASKVISSKGYRGLIHSNCTDWFTMSVAASAPRDVMIALLAACALVLARRRSANDSMQEVA